jgi:hypothetical protein
MNPGREKVNNEGRCRVCGGPLRTVDAAHTWDRSLGSSGYDDPDLVIPLCSLIKGGIGCHDAYDKHQLDLLPYMTTDEQVAMVREAKSMARAMKRATNG